MPWTWQAWLVVTIVGMTIGLVVLPFLMWIALFMVLTVLWGLVLMGIIEPWRR